MRTVYVQRASNTLSWQKLDAQRRTNIEDLIYNVNIQLEFLYTWLCCNKLSLNINKTSYTIFRPQSNAHNNLNNCLLINHEVIKSSEESTKAGTAKLLGIYIDKHLTWSQHIDYLCTSIDI